jgi:nucleotide-diphospho-sugar transferase
MKTYAICTPSFEPLLEIFEKTAPADLDLNVLRIDAPPEKGFRSDVWYQCLIEKARIFRDVIADHQGETLALLDIDIQFFAPCESTFLAGLADNDIAFQAETAGNQPEKTDLNSGVVVVHCNERTLALYGQVCQLDLPRLHLGDQSALIDLINRKVIPGLRYSILPYTVWAWSHTLFNVGPTRDMVLHHANCTTNPETTIVDKLRQMDVIRLQHAWLQYEIIR